MDIQLLNGSNADGHTDLPVDKTVEAELTAMHSDAVKGLKDMLAGKTSDATSTRPTTVQPPSPPVAAPPAAPAATAPAEPKMDVPKQFQAKDGSLDEDKILKSTQHLEQVNARKRDLLEMYNNRRREGQKIDNSIREVKPKEESTPPPRTAPDLSDYLSGQLTKEELDALENAKNEPVVRALLKSQAALTKATTEDVRREIELAKAKTREVEFLERMDELATTHSWLYTDEGRKRLDDVFKADVGLWNTNDPFGYAVAKLAHEMAPQAASGEQARPVGTPILGAGHALPPSQAEPVSPSQQLDSITQSILSNLDDKDGLRKAENELRKKFREVITKR